jgi:S1 RNA binding domain protein
MGLEIGSIVEGRVTGITKFGAFVALPGGKSGLVHISEVANSFVSDVHDHVQMGQTVKVRILSVSDEGKINLSIKRAEEAPAEPPRPEPRRSTPRPSAPAPQRTEADGPSADLEFEDRLKKFLQEADSRIADNRLYADRRSRSRRR